MPSEKSCGAVVFFDSSEGRKYLLLKHGDGHFDFPKGHAEAGESEGETAVREAIEETGISVSLMPGFKESISYFYTREKQKFRKEVVFFIGRAGSDKVALSEEHTGFLWLSYEKALSAITFSNSRAILEKSESFLNQGLIQRIS
jgi:bis(5'-nucleosidyl)-tetraphosphatase